MFFASPRGDAVNSAGSRAAAEIGRAGALWAAGAQPARPPPRREAELKERFRVCVGAG